MSLQISAKIARKKHFATKQHKLQQILLQSWINCDKTVLSPYDRFFPYFPQIICLHITVFLHKHCLWCLWQISGMDVANKVAVDRKMYKFASISGWSVKVCLWMILGRSPWEMQIAPPKNLSKGLFSKNCWLLKSLKKNKFTERQDTEPASVDSIWGWHLPEWQRRRVFSWHLIWRAQVSAQSDR